MSSPVITVLYLTIKNFPRLIVLIATQKLTSFKIRHLKASAMEFVL